jgi:hypothetical protein
MATQAATSNRRKQRTSVASFRKDLYLLAFSVSHNIQYVSGIQDEASNGLKRMLMEVTLFLSL